MKATFLIALPRCGSLALSQVMNTDHCLAHHEGNDFNNVGYGEQLRFENTYAYKVYRTALSDGKDYFCCDTSLGVDLFESFTRYLVENRLNTTIKAQALFIRIDPGFVVNSIRKNNVTGFNQETMYAVTLAIESEVLRCAKMLMACKWFSNNQAIIIDKQEPSEDGNSLRFTVSQLTEISAFVGAVRIIYGKGGFDIVEQVKAIVDKAEQPISMPPEQLQKNIDAVEAVVRNRSLITKRNKN